MVSETIPLQVFCDSVIGCYTEHRLFEEPTQGSLAILRTTAMSQLLPQVVGIDRDSLLVLFAWHQLCHPPGGGVTGCRGAYGMAQPAAAREAAQPEAAARQAGVHRRQRTTALHDPGLGGVSDETCGLTPYIAARMCGRMLAQLHSFAHRCLSVTSEGPQSMGQ